MTRWAYMPKRNTKSPVKPFPHAGEGEFMEKPQKASKYHSKKTEIDGIIFDSSKEARRYAELKILEKAGEIKDLILQERFELLPTQREPDIIGPRGGIKKGEVIEKGVYYTADFSYTTKTGERVVEDVKSPASRTQQYILRRKMMLFFHGIRIKEV